MTVHSLEIASRSHIGLVRTHNEDYLAVDGPLGVAVLADGMGGHNAGEVASRTAVERILLELLPAQRADRDDDLQSLMRVGQAVEKANKALFIATDEDPELAGMGTTVVLALFRDGRIYYAHVGDSRIYRFRKGELQRLTRDHTLIQRLVDEGMFASYHAARAAGIGDNVLLRGLGIEPELEVDVGDAALEVGDLFLMCSDGLCGFVTDYEIRRVLNEPEMTMDDRADVLLEVALARGGIDNISLILIAPRLLSGAE